MSEAENVNVEEQAVEPALDRNAELTKLRTDESRRIDSIRQIAEKFELDALGRDAISEGWSVEQFNAPRAGEGRRAQQRRPCRIGTRR
jgi:hypothetical protein